MRNVRQSKILDLIQNKEICSQEELISALNEIGFTVNQSTISRDIKELGLVKISLDNGKSKYAYIDFEQEKQRITKKCINIFKEAVLSIDSSESLVVIRTLAGSANAACMAVDKMGISGIIGSIAGDDTLLIIAKSKNEVVYIVDSLKKILLG